MTEHRRIHNGEDALETCAACAWASWDTAPSFAEHVELMAAIDAEALAVSESEEACIAPPGNLCADPGCWDADRCVVARPSARESAWAEFRDGPDYTPTDRYPVRDAFDAGWSLSLASVGSEGWFAYAAEQERHAETTARLELMTREARLSREATEKAVRRLERLRSGVAHLHDVYAAPPNEPRCCSDCAANDISDELRRLLADTHEPCACGHSEYDHSASNVSGCYQCECGVDA